MKFLTVVVLRCLMKCLNIQLVNSLVTVINLNSSLLNIESFILSKLDENISLEELWWIFRINKCDILYLNIHSILSSTIIKIIVVCVCVCLMVCYISACTSTLIWNDGKTGIVPLLSLRLILIDLRFVQRGWGLTTITF